MNPSLLALCSTAVLPIVGSFIVLAIAGVGLIVWISHVVAIALACALSYAGYSQGQRHSGQIPAWCILGLMVVGVMLPLLGDASGPRRWVALGPLNFYMAALVLPSLIVVCEMLIADKRLLLPYSAVLVTCVVLTLQPDASQAVALLVAAIIVAQHHQVTVGRLAMLVLPLLLLVLWVFSKPDPLMPVPYVEEVFATAWQHSVWAGVAVMACGMALLGGLWRQSSQASAGCAAVAGYYAILFICSSMGMTPAPLLGYGAGPVLGFGLMVAVLGWLKRPETVQADAINE